MTAVAVVLAGGKGTRSAVPTRAKLGQDIAGDPLMAWHLRALELSEIRQAIVVAGHLGDQVQALCDSLLSDKVRVEAIHEERQEGTMAALRLASSHTSADEFLVILGDVLMSMPVQKFLEEWRSSGAGVAVVVHPSSHPEDSDAACPSFDGSVLVVPKSSPRDGVPNMSSAGLFAMSRAALNAYGQLRDIGSDVLPAAASKGDLFAFVSSHYLKDTGTPSRLDAARADVAAGAFTRRGSLSPRPALFLDRDGVINPSEPDFHHPDGYCLLPCVAEAIRSANQAGVPVIVVTNQPAIAKGQMSYAAHQQVRARMDALLGAAGAFVDDYFFCPHHPERGFVGEISALKIPCECRKPGMGMAEAAVSRHSLDLGVSVMVGDTDRDRGFASAAGMRFFHVSEDCPDGDTEDCFLEAADAIRRGVEVVTC